jgi:hypothetical protein
LSLPLYISIAIPLSCLDCPGGAASHPVPFLYAS